VTTASTAAREQSREWRSLNSPPEALRFAGGVFRKAIIGEYPWDIHQKEKAAGSGRECGGGREVRATG